MRDGKSKQSQTRQRLYNYGSYHHHVHHTNKVRYHHPILPMGTQVLQGPNLTVNWYGPQLVYTLAGGEFLDHCGDC